MWTGFLTLSGPALILDDLTEEDDEETSEESEDETIGSDDEEAEYDRTVGDEHLEYRQHRRDEDLEHRLVAGTVSYDRGRQTIG